MNYLFPEVADGHVLVVGDVMLDRYIHGRTDRISQEAAVPIVQIDSSEDCLGGAANVALNVVSLGGRCTLVGAVGDDPSGRAIADLLADAGIAADLVVARGWRTTLKERIVSRQKQLLRMDFELPLPDEAAEEVASRVANHVRTATALVVEDYDKGTLARPRHIVDLARAHGVPVIADPKFKPFAEYRGVHVLKPNRCEFQQALGHWPDEQELREVGCAMARRYDVDAIALTRGADGLTLFQADGATLDMPAASVEVYDSTGAGDTVAATLGICTALDWPLAQSVQAANVAGGLVCAKFGTATVSVDELNHIIRAQDQQKNGQGQGNGQAKKRQAQKSLSHRWVTEVVAGARRRGERIVFTNGCFDILHAGHVGYLNEASQLGDRLIVAVNDDDSARRLKGGGRPVNRLEQRMQVLEGLTAVDWVVPFSEDTPEALLAEIRPDVLAKGGDYAVDDIVGASFVRGYGGDVRVLSLVDDCSTSNIIEHLHSAN